MACQGAGGESVVRKSADDDAGAELVPASVLDAARSAFASRDRGAEVLDLVADSLLDGTGAAGPRRLVFGSDRQPTQVHVVVAPSDAAEPSRAPLSVSCAQTSFQLLEVRSGGDPASVSEIGIGRWAAGPVDHGMLIIVGMLDGRRLQTAAVRI